MSQGRIESYHQPVLVSEVVELLTTNPVGVYLDLTVGGGGHLRAMGAHLDDEAKLFGADKDAIAVARATEVLTSLKQTGQVLKGSFGDLKSFVSGFEVDAFDGILLDLGLSSRQIDDATRGFSFGSDGPLDMRFDATSVRTAADLVNEATAKQLTEIIRDYGEERKAKKIAMAIVEARQDAPIMKTSDLTRIVKSVEKGPHQTKCLARVFQSIRIAINSEMSELEKVLPAAIDCLAVGGRLAVISYHSLEDRQVKRFFRSGSHPINDTPFPLPAAQLPQPTLKLITKKPVLPSEAEIEDNSRARSAKLRVAEKLV